MHVVEQSTEQVMNAVLCVLQVRTSSVYYMDYYEENQIQYQSTHDTDLYPTGNRVHKHCTEFTSTSCVPCTDSTFLDEPNGLTACIPCTNCDPGFGLKVMQPCRPSSDTVCGTLEGFYCLDPTKDGCRAAQRHSSCKPGQYISHTGMSSCKSSIDIST